MKKILLATSALATVASFGASAHTRDGLVESSHNRLELAITGEISAFTGYTSATITDYEKVYDAEASAYVWKGTDTEYTGTGLNYSADIDLTATTHVRDWDIEGVIQLDISSAENGDAVEASEVYVDFTKANIGTFRVGRGDGPSEDLSLEANVPGVDFQDITGDDDFNFGFARFADAFNQIGYYSPNFYGFEFGIAYGYGYDGYANNAYRHDSDNADFVEIAAKYTGEFSGFSYGISGAYRMAMDNTAAVQPGNTKEGYMTFADLNNKYTSDKYTVGLSLGYMGFNWTTTYGEWISNADFVDGYGIDRYGIATALTYSWDRWTVGAGYQLNEREASTPTMTDTTTLQTFELGAEYDVFDGLVWKATAAYADFDRSVSYADPKVEGYTVRDGDAFQFITGFDLRW